MDIAIKALIITFVTALIVGIVYSVKRTKGIMASGLESTEEMLKLRLDGSGSKPLNQENYDKLLELTEGTANQEMLEKKWVCLTSCLSALLWCYVGLGCDYILSDMSILPKVCLGMLGVSALSMIACMVMDILEGKRSRAYTTKMVELGESKGFKVDKNTILDRVKMHKKVEIECHTLGILLHILGAIVLLKFVIL